MTNFVPGTLFLLALAVAAASCVRKACCALKAGKKEGAKESREGKSKGGICGSSISTVKILTMQKKKIDVNEMRQAFMKHHEISREEPLDDKTYQQRKHFEIPTLFESASEMNLVVSQALLTSFLTYKRENKSSSKSEKELYNAMDEDQLRTRLLQIGKQYPLAMCSHYTIWRDRLSWEEEFMAICSCSLMREAYKPDNKYLARDSTQFHNEQLTYNFKSASFIDFSLLCDKNCTWTPGTTTSPDTWFLTVLGLKPWTEDQDTTNFLPIEGNKLFDIDRCKKMIPFVLQGFIQDANEQAKSLRLKACLILEPLTILKDCPQSKNISTIQGRIALAQIMDYFSIIQIFNLDCISELDFSKFPLVSKDFFSTIYKHSGCQKNFSVKFKSPTGQNDVFWEVSTQ